MIKYLSEPVKIALGILKGRDAIYLDELRHTFSPSSLFFSGEFNTRLCSDYNGKCRWIEYRLKFLNVVAYKCWEFDVCPLKKSTCFDIVQDSPWIHELSVSNCKHYALSTYDYIYEVAYNDFELEYGNKRNKLSRCNGS